ncbi:MAG: hypothetical protein IJX99_03550 [Clostridia bacterium]|nr:hypothetical protein [Clostridia bacterium]
MKKILGIKSQPQIFPSARRFNKIVDKHNANCLAFAFGQSTANLESFDLLTMEQISKLTHHQQLEEIDICKAFVDKALEFGYQVEQTQTHELVNGKVAFILFGWYSGYLDDLGIYNYFFHVVRKNENGSFEHKSDWFSWAKKLSTYRLKKMLSQDVPKYYFVLKN